MKIQITKSMVEKIGVSKLVKFGVNADSWSWKRGHEFDLTRFSRAQLAALQELLKANTSVQGVRLVLKDIDTFLAACTDDVAFAQATSVRGFETILKQFMLRVTGHRVYERVAHEGVEVQSWLAYYVNSIKYTPKKREDGVVYPAYVTMYLAYEELAGHETESVTFYARDCVDMTVAEAVVGKGYFPETEALRKQYLESVARFKSITQNIGKQYLASGTATDDMDGNPGSGNRWSWRNNCIQMVRDGEPTRVVADVFFEEAENKKSSRDRHNVGDYWATVTGPKKDSKSVTKNLGDDDDEDDEDDDNVDGEVDDGNISEVEVPIHPYVAIFDLKKHLRLRIHADCLVPYVYDTTLADKLILPKEEKDLVGMLVESKGGGFTDVVKGKGDGAVILLAGAPGTGKTLTAEIYAEADQRALYSVQCSQLGLEPEELETSLVKVLGRASRWGAVALLDEADVYSHRRGDSISQNAIVGVFLRVLEYQNSVLFMTTNRPEDVDDAIASRCIARLVYEVPTRENRARIWRVLADSSKIELSDKDIEKLVDNHPETTGRDIKNLLKLGNMYAKWTKGKVTPAVIAFVKKFKPTGPAHVSLPDPNPTSVKRY